MGAGEASLCCQYSKEWMNFRSQMLASCPEILTSYSKSAQYIYLLNYFNK